jgi:hypothetical protein
LSYFKNKKISKDIEDIINILDYKAEYYLFNDEDIEIMK